MKILSLDLGDQWTGSAISDNMQIIASPYKTIETKNLNSFLEETIKKENLQKIIIGYPKTMKGTLSEQTKKTIDMKNKLEQKFNTIEWILWDERLTSKMASNIKKTKNKEEKLKLHSIAAALVLESYLDYLKTFK